jgi:hypothetical protein
MATATHHRDRAQPDPTNPPTTPPTTSTLIQGWDAESVMTNMDQNLINLWNDLPHPKILVYQWEAGYQPSGSETAQKLKSAIAQLFSIPEPKVGPPYAANKSTHRYSPPWCYLVMGLPAATAEQLIGQLFWTTPSITFFAIPYAPLAYDFICTIENFTFHEDETHKALKVVMSSILTNQQACACVLRDNPNLS